MMIEKEIRDYLTPRIAPPVYIDRKGELPDAYVVIERTGGGESETLRRATIAIQCYSHSLYTAATIAEVVHSHMMDGFVSKVSAVRTVSAPYNFSPGVEGKCRYQAVYEVYYFPRW